MARTVAATLGLLAHGAMAESFAAERAAPHGAAAGGQSYMDYGKWLQGGQFQQYMDYQKWTQGAGAGHGTQGKQGAASDVSGQGAQGMGSYEKYMAYGKDYMKGQAAQGDYQKYMATYTKGQGQGAQGASDYQQYLATYAKGQGQGAQGASDYQQYLATYVKGQGQGAQGASDYQQYLATYAKGQGQGAQGASDYQQYMATYAKGQGQGANDASDYQQYMAYSKDYSGSPGAQRPMSFVAEAGDDSEPQSSSASGREAESKSGAAGAAQGAAGDYKQYADYQKYLPKGAQRSDWSSGWQEFQQQQQGQQVPYSAVDCKTEEELKAWHKQQLAMTHQWVPQSYQGPSLQNIEQEYESNLARIRNETSPASEVLVAAQPAQAEVQGQVAPQYLFSADACNTTEQLQAWRAKQEEQIKHYVPADYRKFAEAPIAAKYKKRLEAIQAASRTAPSNDTEAAEVPATPQRTRHQATEAADVPDQAAPTTEADKQDAGHAASSSFVSSPAAASSSSAADLPEVDAARRSQSVSELLAWRSQQDQLLAALPADAMPDAHAAVEAEMKANLMRLQTAAKERPYSVTAAEVAAAGQATPSRTARALLLASFGVALAAVVALGLRVARQSRSLATSKFSYSEADEHFISLAAEA